MKQLLPMLALLCLLSCKKEKHIYRCYKHEVLEYRNGFPAKSTETWKDYEFTPKQASKHEQENTFGEQKVWCVISDY